MKENKIIDLKYFYDPQELIIYEIKVIGIQKDLFDNNIKVLNGISRIYADHFGIVIPSSWKNATKISIRDDIIENTPLNSLQVLNTDLANKINVLKRNIQQLEIAKTSIISSLKSMIS